ncbi:MAG: SCO family protein [Xanthomonadales bacterium]|nr:SCO family protein [Xanthomonadales bacterium]
MRGSARLPVLGVLAVALAAGLGLVAAQHFWGSAPAPRSGTPAPALRGTLLYPQPRAVADFALQRADGSALTRADLLGHWTVLFIGFTHCPDVCPTTLGLLAEVTKRWPEAQQRPQVLFVAVDPERDTAEKAQEYASFFDPEFIGASGDLAELEQFSRGFGMVFMKTALPDGGYTIDHSSSLSLIGPDATLRGVMRPPLQPDAITADLGALMRAETGAETP